MVNHDFSLPVYIAKGVATSGHYADLGPLVIGIFDRKTSSVATATGNGKEFFLAGGSPHTRDTLTKFYKGMKTPKKSSYFYGKDILAFEKSYPTKPDNEEWVLGYDGSSSSKTLAYECSKQYQLKIRLYGEPAFTKFNKSLEKIISLNTPCCPGDDCAYDCPDTKLGVKAQTIAWVKAINDNVELQEFKIKAYPVFSDYNGAATTGAFTGGTGTAATASIQTSGGVITGVTVLTPGAYSVAPTGFTATNTAGGSGATFTIQSTGTSPNITVTGVTVTAGGTGYTSAGANAHEYTLTVTDNGDAVALQDVQRANPGKDIYFIKRAGTASVYGYKGAAAPGNFTPTAPVLFAICGACDSGYTLVAERNSYIVKRQLSLGTDLSSGSAQTSFAATVVSDYSGVTGSGVYLGLANGEASVKILKQGTITAALTDDVIETVGVTPAYCTPSSPSAIAWATGSPYYTTTRTLSVTVSDEDCTKSYTAAQVNAAFLGVKSYVASSATDVTGSDSCTKTFTIQQTSQFMSDVCMSPDVASYDELPAFHGYVFKPVVVADDAYDATIKAGIRITAPFYSAKFGDSSFDIYEYYDAEPLRMEVSLYDQNLQPCKFSLTADARRTKLPKYRRLSGEAVIRQYIAQGVYFVYEDWANDQRMQEIIDNTALKQVKREKFYVAYYLRFKEARPDENFNQKGHIFEPVIYVEEGDVATQQAIENALQAVTAKFHVGVENRG